MLKQVGHSDLAGQGAAMQVMASGRILYVGSMRAGEGTTVVDADEPSRPRIIGRLPGYSCTKMTKTQTSGDLLLVNYEQGAGGRAMRTGFSVFDISKPRKPTEVCYYDTGGLGVHRIWYSGGHYAYLSAVPPGFADRMLIIIDMKNPEQPEESGRWWLPGQWIDGGEEPRWPATLKIKLHHALVHGGSAYLGYWDGGLIVLDISDVSRPRPVSRVSWAPHQGGCTHTALPLPGRRLLAVVDESTRELDKEPPKYVRLLDITDERVPKVLSRYRPDPQGAAWPGVRFGPHNLHENRPESYISEDVLFVTCFAAGLKILDISDPHNPREIKSFVPQEAPQTPQLNDVFVTTEGLVYVTDRSGLGLYILETKET